MRRTFLRAVLHIPHLIRFRLTLWYTSLAAAVLAAFVGSVFYTFSQYQFQSYTDQITQVLTQTLNKQAEFAFMPHAPYYALRFSDPDAPNKSGFPMIFFTPDGKLLSKPPDGSSVLNSGLAKKDQQLAAQAAKRNAAAPPVVTDTGQWRFITLPLSYEGTSVIGQIAIPMQHVQQQIEQLKAILSYSAAVLLLISALGGWLLAGRALRPIDEISRRARQISARDLSQRINLDQDDELGRMARTFDDLIDRLQGAFDRQARFTSDASHELRTPLTAMKAQLGLALARPRTATEYRETLISVDEEVQRLTAIVADLLMLTRFDSHVASMQRQAVALDQIMMDLIDRVEVITLERSITIDSTGITPLVVQGDPTRLRQLLTNLLDNALTYTPDGGRITLSLTRQGDSAQVRITDTGIGIAPNDLPHIFERFFRSSTAREYYTQGTGLGLAIAQAIAEAHEGKIAVQSVLDQGTTFTVILPISPKMLRQRHMVWPWNWFRRRKDQRVAPVSEAQPKKRIGPVWMHQYAAVIRRPRLRRSPSR